MVDDECGKPRWEMGYKFLLSLWRRFSGTVASDFQTLLSILVLSVAQVATL